MLQRLPKLTAMLVLSAGVFCGCNTFSGWNKPIQSEYVTGLSVVTWQEVYPHLFGVWSRDGQRVWAVGGDGNIISFNDGGETWTTRQTGYHERLWAITASDDGRQLWAVGSHGTILLSADAGVTWTAAASPTSQTLWAISGSADGHILFAVGSGGAILSSTDGGRAWEVSQSQTNLGLNAVYVLESGSRAWAVGEKGVLVSYRQGSGWTARNTTTNSELNGIHGSTDGQRLWAVGKGGAIEASSDSGLSWVTETSTTDSNIRGVFSDHDGTRVWACTEQGEILSLQGTNKWTKNSPTELYLTAMTGAHDASTLWVAGGQSTILKSTDGGIQWLHKRSRLAVDLASVVTAADGSRIWAVGKKGSALLSKDGGETWRKVATPTDEDLSSVFCATNCERIWIVGTKGQVWSSTDGGSVWSKIQTGVTDELDSMTGTSDGNKLWACGDGGLIIASNDSGRTWVRQQSNTGNALSSIYRDGEGGLWAVGSEGANVGSVGVILHSVNDGLTWEVVWEGNDDLNSIYATGREAWAVGNGLILHSADNGHSWAQRNSSKTLYGVWGTQSKVWAVGEHGAVFGYDRNLDQWVLQPQRSTSDLQAIVCGLNDCWAVGGAGTILRTVRVESLPQVTATRLVTTPSGVRLDLQTAWTNSSSHENLYGVTLYGSNQYEFDHGARFSTIKPKVTSPQEPDGTWSFEFDPEKDLGVKKGETINLKVQLKTASALPEFVLAPVRYDPWFWVRENRVWLLPLAAIVAVLAAFALLLLFRPLWLLTLYRKAGIYEAVEKIPLPAAVQPIRLLLKLTILPLFVWHRRTLDAWIERYASVLLESFETDAIAQGATDYIPLPIRLGRKDGAEVIDKPNAAALMWLFAAKRTLVEVVAPGGAGKTMLAIQIGRWGLARELTSYPMVPIVVDQDTEDVGQLLVDKLRSWLGEEEAIEKDFVYALLRKKRLLVIVDRLSERGEATKEHFRSAKGAYPLNCLLITARHSMDLWATKTARIEPQSLDSGSLLYFMTTLLSSSRHQKGFATIRDQIGLGERLAKLVRVGNAEAPITPLLVRLFVDKAMALAAAESGLDHLPKSIPDAYFTFLKDINPQDSRLPNFMSHEDMLRAAESVAGVCCGDFVPREFTKSAARICLASCGWADPSKLDPVQRLVDNGVLAERPMATDTFLRFTLDPIAEFLAAMALAKNCGRDVTAWKTEYSKMVEKGDAAEGFRSAFRLISDAYGNAFNWPLSQLWAPEEQTMIRKL